jgi:hypothetical protein
MLRFHVEDLVYLDIAVFIICNKKPRFFCYFGYKYSKILMMTNETINSF